MKASKTTPLNNNIKPSFCKFGVSLKLLLLATTHLSAEAVDPLHVGDFYIGEYQEVREVVKEHPQPLIAPGQASEDQLNADAARLKPKLGQESDTSLIKAQKENKLLQSTIAEAERRYGKEPGYRGVMKEGQLVKTIRNTDGKEYLVLKIAADGSCGFYASGFTRKEFVEACCNHLDDLFGENSKSAGEEERDREHFIVVLKDSLSISQDKQCTKEELQKKVSTYFLKNNEWLPGQLAGLIFQKLNKKILIWEHKSNIISFATGCQQHENDPETRHMYFTGAHYDMLIPIADYEAKKKNDTIDDKQTEEERHNAEEDARKLREQQAAEAKALKEQGKAEEERRKAEEVASRASGENDASEQARILGEQQDANAKALKEQGKAEEERRKAEEEARKLSEQQAAAAKALEEQRKAEEERRKAEEAARKLSEQQAAAAKALEEQCKRDDAARLSLKPKLEQERKANEDFIATLDLRAQKKELERLQQARAKLDAPKIKEQKENILLQSTIAEAGRRYRGQQGYQGIKTHGQVVQTRCTAEGREFVVLDILGDGNCGFYALGITRETLIEWTKNYINKYYGTGNERFEAFKIGLANACNIDIEIFNSYEKDQLIGTVIQYFGENRGVDSWFEAGVFVDVLTENKVKYTIWYVNSQAGKLETRYGSENKDDPETRHMFFTGAHYDMLIPIADYSK